MSSYVCCETNPATYLPYPVPSSPIHNKRGVLYDTPQNCLSLPEIGASSSGRTAIRPTEEITLASRRLIQIVS